MLGHKVDFVSNELVRLVGEPQQTTSEQSRGLIDEKREVTEAARDLPRKFHKVASLQEPAVAIVHEMEKRLGGPWEPASGRF